MMNPPPADPAVLSAVKMRISLQRDLLSGQGFFRTLGPDHMAYSECVKML